MTGRLSAEQRATFLALADILAPAAEGMPSASQVRLADQPLDEALNYRPDLFAPLVALLRQALGRDPEHELRQWAQEAPEAFHAFGLLVAGSYYLSPVVRERIGYHGQERRAIDPDEVPEYVSNGMLARMAARAPMWRDPAGVPDGGTEAGA